MTRTRRIVIRTALTSARRALRALEKALTRLAAQARTSAQNGSAPAKGNRRPMKLSPARLKALRLHGRYLGYVRQLKPRQRAQVKAVREKKGVKAAIKRAQKLAATSTRQ